MVVLYGLQKQEYRFELKGGTSLSKGFGLIERFSEDIDIRIQPGENQNVATNPKQEKDHHIESRKNFYDQLAKELSIDGIVSVERDTEFDDPTGKFRSGGIRLFYNSLFPAVDGIKEGILLEVGFDDVTPNMPQTISSWALDRALSNESVEVINNRAIDVACYHPGYTFVEKLQTIATKFRREKESGEEGQNFLRQYYDVSQLLKSGLVQEFIGTGEYESHKQKRFPKADIEIPLLQNEAFLLKDSRIRERFKERYLKTKNIYYRGQPDFDEILSIIGENLGRL